MAGNYLENIHMLSYVFSGEYLLCHDDSTSMGLRLERKRERREAAQGLFVFGQDKSEVSFWIFNILKGTKHSYSSLVSGGFWRGGAQSLSKCVCELLHASYSIAEWFA